MLKRRKLLLNKVMRLELLKLQLVKMKMIHWEFYQMLPREMKLKKRDLAKGSIAEFVQKHYHHFNASVLREATDAYIDLLNNNGMMFVSIAGAMSTGELGISLAEMIRKKKVH